MTTTADSMIDCSIVVPVYFNDGRQGNHQYREVQRLRPVQDSLPENVHRNVSEIQQQRLFLCSGQQYRLHRL